MALVASIGVATAGVVVVVVVVVISVMLESMAAIMMKDASVM